MKRARTDDATLLGTDLDDRCGLTRRRNSVDSLCPAVEHVIVAVRALLKSRGLTKPSSDLGGEAARRRDNLDPALALGQTQADQRHQANEGESGEGRRRHSGH